MARNLDKPRALLLGLTAALAFGGCHCGRKPDAEILRARIDTTPVHLYVASKIAVTKADASPEVAEAKKQLFIVLDVLDKARAASAVPVASASAVPVASAAPAVVPAAASSAAPPALGAADYARLAVALWKLRAEGQALVRSGGEEGLTPVLPVLLRDTKLPGETLALFDTQTEHALFLMAFFLARIDTRSPVPVPDEIVLYEAFMTRSGAMKLAGFEPLVQAIKAAVYGSNALCDLAAAEAAGADRASVDVAAAVESSRRLAGGQAAMTAVQAETANTAARALAHGYAGVCYFGREQRAEGVAELDHFLSLAHTLGVPLGETALLRAYVAYEKGDHDAARRALEEARDFPGTDPDTRAMIEQTLPRLARNDDGAVRKAFGKATLALLAGRIVYRQLERAGVFDALADAPPVRKLRGFSGAVAGGASDARGSLPSLDDVKKRLGP